MIFFFILKMVYCVYSLQSPQWGDSNEKKQHTFTFKNIKNNPFLASWPGAKINPHWLELPLSRTNFHGSKGVPAIEVRLYFNSNIFKQNHLMVCVIYTYFMYLYLITCIMKIIRLPFNLGKILRLLFNLRKIFLHKPWIPVNVLKFCKPKSSR